MKGLVDDMRVACLMSGRNHALADSVFTDTPDSLIAFAFAFKAVAADNAVRALIIVAFAVWAVAEAFCAAVCVA